MTWVTAGAFTHPVSKVVRNLLFMLQPQRLDAVDNSAATKQGIKVIEQIGPSSAAVAEPADQQAFQIE